MQLCAGTGPVLSLFWQHRPSNWTVLAFTGMFMGNLFKVLYQDFIYTGVANNTVLDNMSEQSDKYRNKNKRQRLFA